MSPQTTCPGCRLVLDAGAGLPAPLHGSSPECWALNGRLMAWTLPLGDPEFVHQHGVDAYAVQHAGAGAKPIATRFGLLGLYWTVERGWTGREVQLGHMRIARKKHEWPHFALPAARARLTVKEMVECSEAGRVGLIRQWCAELCELWREQQATVRAWAAASWS